ncbi:type IV secretion system protein [Edaphobacter aggregans]|uniref:type IV secretion system protein n=1 Tax=Edaphobacter aggregans TaxID=570835 RepID=UPI000552005F|nr:type IV secretion system protein [Edaphobacter aggregans]
MDFLILIKNGCDNLTATVSPSVDALGLHMVIALATIMLVWFGVQEALASAQGGPGFSVAKFLSFFLLITFAYCFVKFYDASIPGIGYSLKGFIRGGTSSLVDYIGRDSTQEVQNTVHTALSQVGNLSPSFTEPYMLLCTYTVQVVLCILTGLIGVIIAYGAVGATIIGLLGPVFIPWMVFEKTEFLFWGWLKAFLGFEFYKVVAAATMSVMSHLLITYLTSGAMNINDPQRLIYLMPGLLILCFVAGFILLKIPTMTASLFSGHVGGHGIGMGGLITAAVLRGL